MKITCPSCSTSYAVDAETFPAEGRNVRCARCKNVWNAIAYVPDAEILPPDSDAQDSSVTNTELTTSVAEAPVATTAEPGDGDQLPAETQRATIVDDGTGDGVGSGDVDQHGQPDQSDENSIEGIAAARARNAAQRAGKGVKIRYKSPRDRGMEAFLIAVILAVVVAAVQYREDVVRSLPSMAGLYEMIGVPVNLRGLDFVKISQRRDFEDGVPVLIVEGEISNIEGRVMPVPALRFSLRGRQGNELYAWTVEPRQRVIKPDTPMSFRTRLASPPRGADNVLIRFIERDQRIVEYAD